MHFGSNDRHTHSGRGKTTWDRLTNVAHIKSVCVHCVERASSQWQPFEKCGTDFTRKMPAQNNMHYNRPTIKVWKSYNNVIFSSFRVSKYWTANDALLCPATTMNSLHTFAPLEVRRVLHVKWRARSGHTYTTRRGEARIVISEKSSMQTSARHQHINKRQSK